MMPRSVRARERAVHKEGLDEGIRVMAAVAVIRGRKVLAIREEDEPHRGKWVLPQGYVERGETVADAARREAREELGIEVELRGLVGVYDEMIQSERREVHYITVCYLGSIADSEAPRPSAEAIDSAWIDPNVGSRESPLVTKRMLEDVSRAAARRRPLSR